MRTSVRSAVMNSSQAIRTRRGSRDPRRKSRNPSLPGTGERRAWFLRRSSRARPTQAWWPPSSYQRGHRRGRRWTSSSPSRQPSHYLQCRWWEFWRTPAARLSRWTPGQPWGDRQRMLRGCLSHFLSVSPRERGTPGRRRAASCSPPGSRGRPRAVRWWCWCPGLSDGQRSRRGTGSTAAPWTPKRRSPRGADSAGRRRCDSVMSPPAVGRSDGDRSPRRTGLPPTDGEWPATRGSRPATSCRRVETSCNSPGTGPEQWTNLGHLNEQGTSAQWNGDITARNRGHSQYF